MQVVEKFVSINGEGVKCGQLAVFIRFKGCNLKCAYCDTSWANEADCTYEKMNIDQIVSYILKTNVNNVTLTGGEPLLQPKMLNLLKELDKHPHLQVEIETNGSIDISPFAAGSRAHFTMDYKLESSGCERYMLKDNFYYLKREDTVKFVVGSNEDLLKAKSLIDKYGLVNRCNVYLSPVFGEINPQKIVEFMIDNNMNGANMQLQLHKFIWDPDKRGV